MERDLDRLLHPKRVSLLDLLRAPQKADGPDHTQPEVESHLARFGKKQQEFEFG